MDVLSSTIVATLATLVLGGLVGFVWQRRRREARDAELLEAAKDRNLHVPASLHPVIDPDICIGSLSCLKACPEGDILGVVDGTARLIRGTNCIGHGKCAIECPVGAIRLVFGTSERGVDLPEVDETFETSRAGVHVIGELGGMGLIKNAVTQGAEAAQYVAAKLGKTGGNADGVVDVAIVGAGPAGLAAALGFREAGVSFRILDQSTMGGAIAAYPRQKVVMTETVQLPVIGKFGRRLISKEELLETFVKATEKAKIRVEESVKVEGLEGGDGAFVVKTTAGDVKARKVVLAVGRRGSPRKLGVPGEDLPKVTYRLIDAEQYENCRVLVVGGGDSAIEAAVQLAEESNATVALSYRGEAFGRCREANRQRIEALAASGRVKLLLGTQVTKVTEDAVDLVKGAEPLSLPNDYIIACLGGELPLDFLKKMGIEVRRYHGEERNAPKGGPIDVARLGTPAAPSKPVPVPSAPKVVPQVAKAAKGSAREEADRRHKRFGWTLFTIGVLILIVLAWVGRDYYVLPFKARLRSPQHASLKPAGLWGHGVGLVATAFMLSNFLYAVRKRWSVLKGTAPIRTWLTFHVFVGFMSPLVIVFHAAFQSNNMLATSTFASLLVVVVTGVIGRYIFGLVPAQGGAALELAEVMAQFERMKARLGPLMEELENPGPMKALFAEAAAPAHAQSLSMLLLRRPFDALRLRLHLAQLHFRFREWEHYGEFKESILRLVRLRDQVRFYKSLKKLLAGWRAFHAVLAVFLVLAIAAHIGVSLFLGYTWIFK